MKPLIKQFLQRDAHPLVQFIKYGICGGLATAVDVAITLVLAWKFLPALLPDEPLVRFFGLQVAHVPEHIRAVNYAIDRSIAFLFSNLVAYVTNFIWVFEPGRHSRKKEIALFYAVSLVSVAVGTSIGSGLINNA